MIWVSLKRKTRDTRFFLLAVNPFTKKFAAKKLKNKSARAVVNKLKEILNEWGIRYEKIFSDRGKEFDNDILKNEIERAYNINHYYSNSIKKAAIVERG